MTSLITFVVGFLLPHKLILSEAKLIDIREQAFIAGYQKAQQNILRQSRLN